MFCKHCGKENSDDAVFCKGCGKRLDEDLVCPSCGKKLDADSAFCIYCGQPVTKPVAKPSAPAPEPQAIAQPAPAAVAVQPTANAVSAQPKPERSGTAKKVLNYVATSAVLATAVFSLIFVFFIGCMGATRLSFGGSFEITAKVDLFYYFGEGYKELKSADSLSTLCRMCLYTPVVFGTLVSAITLLIVAIFSITAIVYSIRYLVGKSKQNGAGFALTAYTAFITGALLMLAINNSNQSVDGILTTRCYFNGATIAGTVLTTLCAAAYVGCTVAMRGKELANTGAIVKIVLSFVSLVFVVVILALASLPAYGLKLEDLSYGDSMNAGIQVLMAVLGAMCSTKADMKIVKNSDTVYALLFIACLVLAAVAIVAARLLVKNVNGATNKEMGTGGIFLSAVLSVLALLYLLFTILSAKEFLIAAEYAGGADVMEAASDELNFTYAVPIVMFVFSLITLGVNITQFCLVNKFSKQAVLENK